MGEFLADIGVGGNVRVRKLRNCSAGLRTEIEGEPKPFAITVTLVARQFPDRVVTS